MQGLPKGGNVTITACLRVCIQVSAFFVGNDSHPWGKVESREGVVREREGWHGLSTLVSFDKGLGEVVVVSKEGLGGGW